MEEEDYQKYIDKFRQNIPLWKTDDKEWLAQRKRSWSKIIEREKLDNSNFVKSYWDAEGRFFIQAKPRKSDKEIYLYRRMAYTPFNSIDEIVHLYLKEHVSLRQNLHDQLLTYASYIYRSVPDEFDRVKLISKALYSADYVAKMEPMGRSQKNEFTVICPRDFVILFTGEVRNYINRSNAQYLDEIQRNGNQHYNGHERSLVEVTFEFFLGSLEYSISDNAKEFTGVINDLGIRGVKQICELIEAYDPDIKDKNRDAFIEKSKDLILKNEFVQKIRCMDE